MQTCLCMCSVFVCVLWWHLLAKASLLWLPAWPYQIYTWTCLLSMHMTPRGGNQTSDSEPSLLSSPPRTVRWSFINMMHFCTRRDRLAPLQRWSTSQKHSTILIVIVSFFFLKRWFIQSLGTLPPWQREVELQQNRSPGFGCRYEARPMLNSLVCTSSTKTARGRKSGVADCIKQLWKRGFGFCCTSYFGKEQ